MKRLSSSPLILIVNEMDAPRLTSREIARAHFVAVSLKDGRFHLVKARRQPKGIYWLSHFTEPIGRPMLMRYIGANLAD